MGSGRVTLRSPRAHATVAAPAAAQERVLVGPRTLIPALALVAALCLGGCAGASGPGGGSGTTPATGSAAPGTTSGSTSPAPGTDAAGLAYTPTADERELAIEGATLWYMLRGESAVITWVDADTDDLSLRTPFPDGIGLSYEEYLANEELRGAYSWEELEALAADDPKGWTFAEHHPFYDVSPLVVGACQIAETVDHVAIENL